MPPEYRVVQARTALRAYLAVHGVTLTTLAKKAGVTQGQASKLIYGDRKRWSDDLEKLCQYAEIEIKAGTPPWWEHPELGAAVRRAVGDSEQAQALLGRIVSAMAPALSALQAETSAPRGKKVKP